jgi:hypothetical protein
VDLKPKKGRLKIDSARILEQPGWEADVVDLDAYGSPWTHWRHLVRNFRGEAVTVFLTIGMVKVGGGNFPNALLELCGCKFSRRRIPNGLGTRLYDMAVGFALSDALANGLEPVEVKEAFPHSKARYVGIRLQKMTPKPKLSA